MATHEIVGGVAFVAALVSAAVLVIMITVAARSPGKKSGPENLRHTFAFPAGGSSPQPGGKEAARCHWDCMSGFHWAEDWEKQCALACGLTEKPGVA